MGGILIKKYSSTKGFQKLKELPFPYFQIDHENYFIIDSLLLWINENSPG